MPDTFFKQEHIGGFATKPILIIDKKGILGSALAKKLKEAFLTIFVSELDYSVPNSIHIPFRSKVPKIPNNTFSHIVVVYDGEKVVHAMLPSLLKKARDDNAPFLLVMSRKMASNAFMSELQKRYKKATIILYGDVFGSRVYERSQVTEIISGAVTQDRIVLSHDGLSFVYPIHFDDVVAGILTLVFAKHEESHVYALSQKHPMTALSFAGVLKKLYPHISIDFLKKKKDDIPHKTKLPDGTIFLLDESYPLVERVREYQLSEKKKREPLGFIVPEPAEKGFSFPIKKILISLFIVSVVVLGIPVGAAFAGFAALFSAQHHITGGDIQKAKREVQIAQTSFGFSRGSFRIVETISNPFGLAKQTKKLSAYIATGEDATKAVSLLIRGGEALEQALNRKDASAQTHFIAGIRLVSEARIVLKRLEQDPAVPEQERKTIVTLLKATTLVDSLSDILPDMLGFAGERKYLVLLQNNFELRPGGGFIGSYGLLTMRTGRIATFTVHNVYDADGQLTEHFDPPYALKRYVGIQHLYLRDSNFALDFRDNAQEAARFLTRETGEEVDGVIGIDTYFLRTLLTTFGEIKVPDYNATVTTNNFFLLLEEKAEVDSFAGSTQKQDFLRAVTNGFFQKLSATEKLPYLSIINGITTAIAEKHIAVAFPDAARQNVLTVNNLSGALWDDREEEEGRYNDFVFINEANIGLNKSNYFVRRSIDQQVMLSTEGDLTRSLALHYTNTSTETSSFGGAYKAYVRFVLPLDTEITEITIDRERKEIFQAITDPRQYENVRFVPPDGVEIEDTIEDGKKVYGLYITVDPQKKKSLFVSYTSKAVLNSDAHTLVYDTRIVKQIGTDNDHFEFHFTFPENFDVMSLTNGQVIGSSVQWSTSLATDKSLQVKLSQKD